MLKKMMCLLLIAFILSPLVVYASATNEPVIAVSSEQAVPGSTVDVKIRISNNPGIIGMGLNVHYDNELTLVNVTDGEILGAAMHSSVYSSNPYYLIWANDTAAANFIANGTIATLTFSIDEYAEPGVYAIEVSYDNEDFEIFNFDAETVEFGIMNGSITVSEPSEALIEAFPGSDTQIDHTAKYIYGIAPGEDNLDSRISAKNGYNYSIVNPYDKIGTGSKVIVKHEGIEVEQYTVILFGDVDGDGWYNGMDAFIVSLISAGLLTEENLGTAAWIAADANHDGAIDEADFRLLERAGLLIAEVDQLASREDLIQTNSVYVEYLSMIDQNFTTEELTESLEDELPSELPTDGMETDKPVDDEEGHTTDKPVTVVVPWYVKIFNILMKHVRLILGFFF